jgi:superoxide dismutase, Fe-Mn family
MRDLITLIEEQSKTELSLVKLNYKKTDLEPVMSKATMDYHYSTLAKGYVTRFNEGEGDKDFNEAGAFLHNIFFAQFKTPDSKNKPTDNNLTFIEKHFGNFNDFKEEFKKEALAIQGSGWVYLSTSGKIKTIKNHAIRKDIKLLVDFWEHSYALDWQANKEGYLDNIWKIIDWSKI